MLKKFFGNSAVSKGMLAAAALALSASAFAQHQVAFSDESGTPGSAVAVTFTFTNPGGDSAVEARARISDMSVFSSVDVSGLCADANADFVQCPLNDTNRIVIAMTNFDPDEALDEFTGTVIFNIDAGIDPGDLPITIDIEWNAPADDGEFFTPDEATDGSVEIVAVPPTDANLVIAPASHDFGTQDINDPAQTFDFTLSNDGEEDSLEIGTASVGGAPYSVSGNCNGQTLAPAATCVVTVTFDPAAAGSFSDTLTVTSDVNTVTADLDGAATATADVVFNPPFGPVNLGFGAPGDTLSANGTVTNNGSASADVACSLSGDGVFSVDPSPLAATIGAGETVNFALFCELPDGAEEGDTFSGELSCTIDGEPAGVHNLGCGVSTFEPLPVPTMQAWALALFALMMLLAGAIGIRFFRA